MTSDLLRLFILTILCIPAGVYAADFLPLVGIPGVTDAGNAGFGDYINALYRLSISLAALLAVIKIVAAGAKYMLSDIVTRKEEAKSDIQGALLGLLVILGAFIILNTINTDITNNEFVIEDLKGADSSESRILRARTRLQAAIASCDSSPECEVKNCPFWRTEFSCEGWCSNQGTGSIYIKGDGYIFRTNDRCIITNSACPDGKTLQDVTVEICDPMSGVCTPSVEAQCM